MILYILSTKSYFLLNMYHQLQPYSESPWLIALLHFYWLCSSTADTVQSTFLTVPVRTGLIILKPPSWDCKVHQLHSVAAAGMLQNMSEKYD